MDKIIEILKSEKLIFAVISNKRNAVTKFKKVTVSPFLSCDDVMYQFESFDDTKAYQENTKDYIDKLTEILPLYKNLALFTDKHDYQILIGKKGNVNIKKSAPTKELKIESHNKSKNYYFKDGVIYDFLVELGISTTDGKIKPTKYNKFVQINKYIEILGKSIKEIEFGSKISIVDFGCGKAYLTFALYYYLTKEFNKDIEITGIDLKEDVISQCTDLAKELNYTGMKFVLGDINNFDGKDVDIAVSLHACDTATDIAILKAVEWGSKLIVAVPCCHHQLFDMIENQELIPILQYGVLKDKFASILTDAIRGLALQTVGYDINIMEFTPVENTPKNVLIKAIYAGGKNEVALKQYNELKKMFNISPYIDRMCQKWVVANCYLLLGM